MSGRLEVGCLAMIVGVQGVVGVDRKRGFVGVKAILVHGPYELRGKMRWDLSGDEIRAAKAAMPVFYERCTPNLVGVPASILVRIDDPDVKLTDGQDIPRAMPRGVMA